jgi:transposase
VVLVDESGKLVAKQRISDDADGLRRLLDLLTEAGYTADAPIPVAAETARGLLISCLRATGRAVYSINPMAVARYRERHRVARTKSDHADAVALANILRTDARMHRPLPADSELVAAIAVLARAQQDTVWNRGQLSNQHFEVEHEDKLRKVGMSKERRVDPQVQLGLLVDPSGFPLEVCCFEGNAAETKTLLPVLTEFAERHQVSDIVVVADAGCSPRRT